MRKSIVLVLTAASLLTGAGAASADRAAPADPHAAACELSWAFHSGATIHEDLSFADATDAYLAANDQLADLFWETQPAGTDWAVAQEDLEDWLDDQITRPCSDLDSGA